MRGFFSPLLCCVRLCALIVWFLTCHLLCTLSMLPWWQRWWRKPVCLFLHRFFCLAAGIRVRHVGAIQPGASVLFIANHISYLDIFVLGAIVPNVVFIAKQDVAQWPGAQRLLKAQAVLVKRDSRAVREQIPLLQKLLAQGHRLILFPEGTSTDGHAVQPFRRSLFTVTDNPDVTVQPLTLAYTHLDGVPLSQSLRTFYAWYGDMDFVSHLVNMLGIGHVTARVLFHPPVPTDGQSRHAMAHTCHRVIASGLSDVKKGLV